MASPGGQPSDKYFSRNYEEGRWRFHDACRQAGAKARARINPHVRGPDGGELAIDYAWLGRSDASQVVVLMCGTHGLEASAGAATMLQWLMHKPAIPQDTGVLLVHGVNAYGWAHSSRGNEDGIDLNRNCIDWSSAVPVNEAYRELHPMIVRAGADEASMAIFMERFNAVIAEKGEAYAISGVTAGQYKYADGLSFGGGGLSWSAQTLFEIAGENLGRAKKILLIDWHTGIGPYGEPFFILDDDRASHNFARASSIWPSHAIHCDDILGDVSPDYTGTLISGMRRALAPLNDALMLFVTIEWGTYEIAPMLEALLVDRWLRLNTSGNDARAIEDARRLVIERFCPAAENWRQNVLAAAPAVYADALAGVSRL
ncbi:MAG: DUF2817 domain-containing protein [Parvularculaceae bacterium]